MEGYEIYRLSDEEIQHVGVKGMKWGKRKSRSSYMKKVDAHEAKTKSVAAAKSTSGSAKRKAYMDAVRANDNKGKAIRDAKAQEKTDKKSANSYMGKVRAHENKTKAVAAAKSESGKAKRKSYMDAVNAHEKKGQDIANAKAKEKQVKKQISDSVKTSKLKENYTKSIEADKATVKNVSDKVLGKKLSDRNATYLKNASKNRKPKAKLSKDEKDAIAEEKFWAKDAKDKARVERNKARMAKVMGQKAVDVLTAPENRVKIAAVTSVIAAYAGTQMGSSKNARLMREFNSHNYKI